MNPKISIITVCYNSAAHVEQAIQSVVSQPYENKEYIVIDGGSTDGTLDIIAKYHNQIDYFVSEPDRGISDAFNKGIKVATGDIIGICNSDDFMMPNVLSRIADEYDEVTDIYRGYCIVWNKKTGKKHTLHPNTRFSIPPFGAIICHESSFISKRLYQKIGLYKTNFKYMMDLDLFIRIYKDKTVRTKFVDVCVITFCTGGVSSSSFSQLKEERKRLILENGGNWCDVVVYLTYHRIKAILKRFY